MSRVIPVLALLTVSALTTATFLGAYYNFVYLPDQIRKQTEERIQPLIERGLTKDEALKFDQEHRDWAPYNSTVVDFARGPWKLSPDFANLLLNATKSLQNSNDFFYNLNATNPEFVNWLFDSNPYFYEYLKDGNLDDYENTVLNNATSIGGLAPYLIRMPEVYTKEANLTDISKYVDLVKDVQAKDFGSAQWILETGLFMEDKVISAAEEQFLVESLSKYDLLRVYVSKFVMDGIQRTPQKSISLDGNPDDWLDINPLVTDAEGDGAFSIPGTDVKAVYAARDSNNLYLMVETYGTANPNNRYVFDINTGSSEFHLQYEPESHFNLWKDGKLITPTDVQGAKGSVAEIKVPLNLLGNPDEVDIFSFIDFGNEGHADFMAPFHFLFTDDFQKLKDFNPQNSGNLGYLTDDLNNLPEIKDGISSQELSAINQLEAIVNASRTDYQIRKGVCLMDEYGVPDQSLFSFSIPNYNTQLQVLLWLAQDRGVPQDYNKVALACGLDYGSVVTIGDDEVDASVRDYVPKIFDFIIETDGIIKQHGADWQARDYPLEADIGLVWGAPGIHYPNDKSLFNKWDEAFYNWYHIFSDIKGKPMDISDFCYLFTELETMKEMREWVLSNFMNPNYKPPEVNYYPSYEYHQQKYPYCYNDRLDRISADFDDYIFVNGEHFDDRVIGQENGNLIINRQYILVDDKIVENAYISNIDWQWDHFKTNGKFLGACVDNSQVQSQILKSVNISSIIGDIAHASPLYYNHKDAIWRTNPYEQNIYLSTDSIKNSMGRYGYSRLPWDNGCLNIIDDVRYMMLHSNVPIIFSKGVPLGYVHRSIELVLN